MLIGFLGAPMTGKTTAALGLCFEMKMRGVPCEFMPEPARHVIDCFGYNDQILIAQMEQDNIDRAKAHRDRIFVTDGGLYLGQFYGGAKHSADDYDVVIFCENVFKATGDTGRIHNYDQSLSIQQKMRMFTETVKCCVFYNQEDGVQSLLPRIGLTK